MMLNAQMTVGDAIIALEKDLGEIERRAACIKLAIDILRRAQAARVRDPNAKTVAALKEADAGGGEVFTGPTSDIGR